MGHVLDALARLERLAETGRLPAEIAREAELIAAGGWQQAGAELGPDRLVLLVAELRRCCVLAAVRHARRWQRLNRAGRPREASEAARWAVALRDAGEALRVYA